MGGGRAWEWLGLVGALLGLGACASTDPFQRVEDHVNQFGTSLGAPEAACLIAEVFAYEFPATQSNPSQPRALVRRYGPMDFEIRYDRGDGSFLPSSNGYLLRPREGIVRDHSIPTRFLGPIRFVAGPSVSGSIGARESIRVRVRREGNQTLIQIQTSLNLLHRKGLPLSRIRPLIDFAGKMQDICDRAPGEKAGTLAEETRSAFGRIGPGFSALQDDLLERAQLIRGNLLMREDRRNAAWLAYQRASIFRPGKGVADRLRGMLVTANARPEQARDRIARSRLLAGPSSLRGRLLALEQDHLARRTRVLQDLDSTLSEGRLALSRGDWKTAKAYAERALDLSPGNTGALGLKAIAQEKSGKLGEALSTQLRVVATKGERPFVVRRLAELLHKNGRPNLAFGRLLRIADQHPNLMRSELAGKILSSLSPLDQLRQARSTGKEEVQGLGVHRPGFASMLLLASPLGRLRPPSPRPSPETVPLPEPYEIDLGPGIRMEAPSTPGK